MNKIKKSVWVLAALAGLFAVSGSVAVASTSSRQVTTAAAPAGFRAFLVYLAEPTLQPGEPSSFTDPAHVDFFQQVIMGRTPAGIAQQQALAIAYFNERFGVDFSAAQPGPDGTLTIPGATFGPFVLNEHVNYHAYVASDRTVPNTGWPVRDGGFQVVLTQGMLLHGSYGGSAGILAPAGASMVFGDYNILVEPPGQAADPSKNILIHYQSHSPIIARADGETSFNCDLLSQQWGPGAARGIAINGTIRNVLTFPAQLSGSRNRRLHDARLRGRSTMRSSPAGGNKARCGRPGLDNEPPGRPIRTKGDN